MGLAKSQTRLSDFHLFSIVNESVEVYQWECFNPYNLFYMSTECWYCYFCCYSVTKLCLTLCYSTTAACQASLSFTIFQSLLKFMSIEPMMPSNHLILCQPLFLPPSFFPRIRVFSNESAFCIRWPQYWNFSFNINRANEYLGLIFFNGLAGSPWSPRDSQESSPTPQFKSFNYSVLSFLYSPTLISIHDYWKSHSPD